MMQCRRERDQFLEALEAHHAWLMANDRQGYVGSALHARTGALLTAATREKMDRRETIARNWRAY